MSRGWDDRLTWRRSEVRRTVDLGTTSDHQAALTATDNTIRAWRSVHRHLSMAVEQWLIDFVNFAS